MDIKLPPETVLNLFFANVSNFPTTLCQNTCISHYRMLTNLRETKHVL